jgi:hypothetical protein
MGGQRADLLLPPFSPLNQIEWWVESPPGHGSTLPIAEWRPYTDNRTASRRLINPCSYQEATVTLWSKGLTARGNYSRAFVVASNSIGGPIPTTITLDIRARINASHSRVIIVPTGRGPTPLADEGLEVRILVHDSEGLPVFHLEDGAAECVTVTVFRQDYGGGAATCSTPRVVAAVGVEGQAYYASACTLPRDPVTGTGLTGTFGITAAVGAAVVGGDNGTPLAFRAACPGNLQAGLTGACICGLGTYLQVRVLVLMLMLMLMLTTVIIRGDRYGDDVPILMIRSGSYGEDMPHREVQMPIAPWTTLAGGRGALPALSPRLCYSLVLKWKLMLTTTVTTLQYEGYADDIPTCRGARVLPALSPRLLQGHPAGRRLSALRRDVTRKLHRPRREGRQ